MAVAIALAGVLGTGVALAQRGGSERLAVIEARGRGRPLVVIDAGHGGKDPGAYSPTTGVYEKDVNLAVSRAIRDALIRSGRVRIAMTRDSDVFVPLTERIAMARRLGADLFVSVHADSAPNPAAHGATVYTLSEVASDLEAARLAAGVHDHAGDEGEIALPTANRGVRAILADLTQRETMSVSADFAGLLQREASGHGVPFRQKYHRFANFVVLRAADTAAVLLELGYLTNEGDARFLVSPEGQARIATGMVGAIETHFARENAERARLAPG